MKISEPLSHGKEGAQSSYPLTQKSYFQAYFCGQHDECAVHGSKWALQLAKSNINKWFPVVAVLERMKDSLQVLEHLLPKFFLGALHHYEKEGGTVIFLLGSHHIFPLLCRWQV